VSINTWSSGIKPNIQPPTIDVGRHRASHVSGLQPSTQVKASKQNKIAFDNLQIPVTFSFKNDEISIKRMPPKIKNLALAGGGPKGLVYADFIGALDKKINLLKNLENISGSSAGSMMAFLLSTGVSIEEIDQYVKSSDLKSQMRGKLNAKSLTEGRGLFSAGNLVEGLKNKSLASVSNYLKDNPLPKNAPEGITKKEWEQFENRANQNFGEGITFGDLKVLNKLNPEQFKLLIITGHNIDKQKVEYFDADTQPNMLCHEAVRISMALPYIVKEVKFQGDRYEDGGVGNNMPLNAFDKDRNHENVNPYETIGLSFNVDGKAERLNDGIHLIKQTLEQREKFPTMVKKVVGFAKSTFSKIVHGEMKPLPPEEIEKHLQERAWQVAAAPSRLKKAFAGKGYVNTIVNDFKREAHFNEHGRIGLVDVGKLGTFSFRASKSTIAAAQKVAEKGGEKFGDQLAPLLHTKKDYFTDVQEAVDQLSPAELQALYNSPAFHDIQDVQIARAFRAAVMEKIANTL